MSEGPEKQPGQKTDVGDTLDEFFRSVREGRVKDDFMFSVSLGAQQMLIDGRE